MNRRQLIASAGGVAILGGLGLGACAKTGPLGAAADPFTGNALMADVKAYLDFGRHRSGSPGDEATTAWFADYWKGLGYTIAHRSFDLPNADTTAAMLEAGGEMFEGFAQPPISFTPEGGLKGSLAVWSETASGDVKGKIAVVHVPRAPGAVSPSASYRKAFVAARDAGALGVLAVVSGPSGDVIAINTPKDMTLGIPVLMVGEKEKARVDAALAAGGEAVLRIEGPGGTRTARNTVATSGTEGPWVIVSTPQSGWFTCGGERGPGIAMSRALSAWALTQNVKCRWLFVATSGHEWTDAGAHLFHAHDAPGPEETALWFHLGASYGARAYEETGDGLKPLEGENPVRTLMVSEDLMASAKAAFAGHVTIENPTPADLATSLGELTLVLEEGYKSSAGFYGAHGLFHTPQDGLDATSGAIMEPIVRAVAKMISDKLSGL